MKRRSRKRTKVAPKLKLVTSGRSSHTRTILGRIGNTIISIGEPKLGKSRTRSR